MKSYLLPYPWKIPGIFISFCGIVMAILYLWFDFRFTLPVFAVFSSFMETKMFVNFNTNFADETILLLLISGFSLIVFSKEKTEYDYYIPARAKAWTKAIITNNIFLLFSVLFVYGSGFIAILIFNLLTLSLFYLFFFYLLKRKQKTDN
jgi:hypothetical protein